MAVKITLNLDETIYARAKLLAQAQSQDVAKALAAWLAETLPAVEQNELPELVGEDDAAVEQEMRAYVALHPNLVQQHKHQYVAIHGGQLVDHDDNYNALLRRIDAAYSNQFVWLTRVEEQPIRQLVFRSPRLTKNG